jgi:hypothetical protein
MHQAYRWEWRTFARSPAYSRILHLSTFGESVESIETYILSAASSNNVKIRNDCLDIKTVVAEDPGGLQQWQPVLTAPFPIDENVLDAAWWAWGLPLPIVATRHCTREEFLRDIVEKEPALRAVDVQKSRRRGKVRDCATEYVRLTVAGHDWESIACEDAEALRVWSAVRSLGLENGSNTSYPEALRKIIGFAPIQITPHREQL